MNPAAAIGFFDSGIGGFSVMRHAIQRLDGRPLIYVADSAHAPYGRRDPDFVRDRCCRISDFLVASGAGAIVVACNTATAIAIDALRERFDVPIIGMEPGVKPAVKASRSGQVAVLATAGTLQSQRYARLLNDHAGSVVVHARACHHWVETVEDGETDSATTQARVDAEVAPLRRSGVDTYVLGCTHFPFLAAEIQSAAGEDARLIDPGPAVIEQLQRCTGITGHPAIPSVVTMYSSGPLAKLEWHAGRLLGQVARAAALPF
jgi:glutamate racemase